jgi:type I restriction enzyme S subunit
MNKCTINDIALNIGSGMTPLRSNMEFWNSSDYPWLKTEQLGTFQIYDTEEYISKAAFEQTTIKLWPPKTISVAMYGEGQTRGKVSIIMKEMATNQACCNIVVNPDVADYRYVYYWLKNNYEQLRVLSSGVRKNLNSDDIKNFPIIVPDLPIQEQIVNVLYVLDKKIELNNRIITELEEMAKTIFDYWFVQFDYPNSKGKPYRSSGGKMVWNEKLKREIPKGWDAGTLIDIANITMGQSPSGKSYNDVGNGTVFYQGRTDFGYRFPTTRMYTTEPTRMASKGDILLSVRAPVGDINIANESCCIGRGLAALNSKVGSNAHLYMLMKNLKPVFDVFNGNGTTFGALTKDTLYQVKVVIPNTSVLQEYERIAGKFNVQIANLDEQNQELIKLRNWLLPMLMNGQVAVK